MLSAHLCASSLWQLTQPMRYSREIQRNSRATRESQPPLEAKTVKKVFTGMVRDSSAIRY